MPLATRSAERSWCDCCWNRCLGLWISITKRFPCGSNPRNNQCHLHLSEVWCLICTQRVSRFLVSWCRFDPEGAWWKHVHHFQGKHTSAGPAEAMAHTAFLPTRFMDYFRFLLSKTKSKAHRQNCFLRAVCGRACEHGKPPGPVGTFAVLLRESLLLGPHLGWKFPFSYLNPSEAIRAWCRLTLSGLTTWGSRSHPSYPSIVTLFLVATQNRNGTEGFLSQLWDDGRTLLIRAVLATEAVLFNEYHRATCVCNSRPP